MSHKEWFESIGLDGKKTVAECVRGFVDERGLFSYKGEEFLTDQETEKELAQHLPKIADIMKLPPETKVYAGVIKSKETRYPPKKRLGTIAELTGHKTKRL